MRLHRRIIPALLLVLFGFCAVFSLAAEEERFPLVFDVAPVLWGLDLGIGYRGLALMPGTDTILWAYGGGAYERRTFVRLPDGSLITGPAPASVDPSEDIFYDRWSARWQLGIAQGFLWNARMESNLLEAELFYRGRYDANIQADADQLIYRSALPDRDGILSNAVLAGICWSDALLDPRTKTKSGIAAEFTVEWGPSFLLNTGIGRSDYIRFNLSARGFIPVLDAAPDASMNVFSLYICDFFSLDYALGRSVPLHIRQSFGGIDPRTGLGGALRGIDSGSLDADLKAVNNFEVRANLPAIVIRDIMPGMLAYWDMGAYYQIGETIEPALFGFVTSVGAGAFLDLFDFAQLIAYLNYRLTGVNADGNSLSFDFDFVLKF